METADDLEVPRFHKLTFPTFDGKTDPLGWLNKCEQFFRGQHTRENTKVWLASFHLTDGTQQWYDMLERDAGGVHNIPWPTFRALCQQRFGPALGTNHLSDLARLPFPGTVDGFIDAFQQRLAHAGSLTQEQVQLFSGGLPDHIRVDEELQMPQDLQRAMCLARAYERRAAAAVTASASRPPRVPARPHHPAAGANPAPTSAATAAPALVPPPPPRPFRRLTPTEMADRRRQGLCYNCDEQYARGHKCQRLFYLEVSDFVDDDEPPQDATPTAPEEPLISLHAIAGIRTADTMRVRVSVGNYVMTALLDTGSTHNFISPAAAARAGLRFGDSAGMTVIVANGDRVSCASLARDIDIRIVDEHFSINCYTIPLDCYDMVLGVRWLRTLGPILWDFDDMCLAFWRRDRRVLWHGLDSSWTALAAASRLHGVRAAEPDLLALLLDDYNDLFAEPTGLPPPRHCDHRIHLVPGTPPVSVRPYRYPQLQKDELEKQCAAMLAQGIIRPSVSPFSAPVLLVKKQDGSWRFCVDFRALNDRTVKDKFPIPVVEELIDELHGARFFTKLDLRAGYHQVRVHPADIEKTAFRTHQGHFEFLVMPFGLSNAPATFQRLMKTMLHSFLRRCVLVFFDDILIYSRSWSEHLQHLRAVFDTLRSHHLKVKRSK